MAKHETNGNHRLTADTSAAAGAPLASGKEAAKGKERLGRKSYEKELRKLQAELCILQDWVKEKGLRVIVVFEGRDAAGKGGTIKAITERVSPRVVPRWSRCPRPPTARSRRCTSSATWRTFRPPARS